MAYVPIEDLAAIVGSFGGGNAPGLPPKKKLSEYPFQTGSLGGQQNPSLGNPGDNPEAANQVQMLLDLVTGKGGPGTNSGKVKLLPGNDRSKALERRQNKDRIYGPFAPEQPEEAAPYDDGSLSAINALMELAGSAPTPGAGGIDIAAIMKNAAGAAGKPFTAQIQSTRNQNERAKADTGESAQKIRKLYRSLSKSKQADAVRESEQSMETAQAVTDMGQASAEQLAAQNQARLNESAAQAAALGSGDLAATLSSEINANTAENTQGIVSGASAAANTMAERGDSERRYLNRSAGNDRLTGTNRAADLFRDLQDYLQGNRDKISELRGQKSAAIGAAQQEGAAAAASAQSDLYSQQYQAHQDMLQNQMALLGMKTDLQQQDFSNNLSLQELALKLQGGGADESPVPGMSEEILDALDPSQRNALILQQQLNPQAGQNLSEAMANPAVRQGFYTDENGQKIPLGGNTMNAEQFLASLGLTTSDPVQNFYLSNVLAQLASGNTDLPYGAQR